MLFPDYKNEQVITDKPVIAWWSGGITSAVACWLALKMFKKVELCYIHINSHHPDTLRFKADCERWYGQEIKQFQNRIYKDQFEVIEDTGYVNGPDGARCTEELKKKVRRTVEMLFPSAYQVWGFECETRQINRAIRFLQEFPDTRPVFPLIENQLDKNECAGIIQTAGIELPAMYGLGYNNNNCIGCTKGGKGYWNKIRTDFPQHFKNMATAERAAGHSCINGTFLDELSPTAGRATEIIIPECGALCQSKFDDIIDSRVDKVLSGEISLLSFLK